MLQSVLYQLDELNDLIFITRKPLLQMKKSFYQWKGYSYVLFFSFSLLLSNTGIAQLSMGGSPISFSQKLKNADVDIKVMPNIDLTAVQKEDQVNDTRQMPYRIAVPTAVSFSLENSGTWEDLDNGDRIWRLNISSPRAKAISLLYSDFFMPKGAMLYLYNEDKSHILGAFSEQNNKPIRQFATALVRGDLVTLEYYEPASVRGQGALTVSQVGHVYRGTIGGIGEDNASLGNSGNCQVDVNCSPEGDNWQNEKRGVAKILINGTGLCTGSLINNVEQDCRPLFLTADHCLGNVDAIANPNAPGWVFYWNFERTGCANLLDPVDDTQTTSGAFLLANAGEEINAPFEDPAAASDFALFLLDENPQGAYDVYFNGFDASGATGMGGVGIHHPAGDAKKIATHSLTPTSVVNNNYWRILPWDATANGQSVTEGGSSGSPLFNSAGNIIGQLFGGFAGGQPNCTDPNNDEGDYGRMDVSWNFGATATRRLRDHLDPNGTGTTIVSGMDQCCMLAVDCSNITDETLSCRADLPPVDFNLPIILESCGDPILSALTIIPGNSGCPGDEVTITRTYFIQDNDGNMDQCMQTFTVISNVAPTISCPANETVECAADISVDANDAMVTSECGTPSVSVSGPVISGTPDCPGTTYTYTYTVTDHCNRMASCDQVFTIDNDPPTITCPADETVECFADISVDPNDVVFNSACSLGFNTVVAGPVQNGPSDCPGTTYTYTYTATDDCGRSVSCEQVFTIDNQGPILTCPADEVVQCVEDIVADPNNLTVVTSCGLDFFAYVKQPLISGGRPGCDGTVYTYIYVVKDECGRSAECEQNFLIQNDAPTVTVPAGTTVECFSDIEVSTSDATVITDCPSDTYTIDILLPEINGPINCPGTTYTYTYRVRDNCNRVVEAQRTFTNGTNAAPTIIAPPNVLTQCLAGTNANPDNAIVTTACGNGIDYTVDVSGPQIIGQQDCPGTIYRYTYTVTDACGRTASDIQDFIVNNSGPIFIGCKEDTWLQFNCEDYGGEAGTIAAIEAYIASVEAYSACGDDLNVTNNFNSNNINTCINNGINTITFRAIDNCGRVSFCTTTYVVVDTEAPDILVDAQDHWEICNYNSPHNFDDWVDNHGGAIAYDGCSNENIFWSTIPANPSFNCAGQPGITSVTVTFVATDNCGNSASTSATFNAFQSGGSFSEQDLPIEANLEQTAQIELLQNRPNPFNQQTTIGFKLPVAEYASLVIFDISGRTLKVFEGDYIAGYNEVVIDQNIFPGAGVYFYRITTENETATRKMIFKK